jgi:hypothetical protein
VRGAPLRGLSPAIDDAGGGRDGFGVDPAETIEGYMVKVMCRVEPRRHVAVAETGTGLALTARGAGVAWFVA